MNEVVAGFFSFTEITDPSAHRAYNAWHALDHMPEQFAIPGIVWGQRWVSTPRCTAARGAAEPPLDRVHYVTLYLMSEPLDATLDAFMQRARELRAADRFFEHRQSHLSGPFRVTGRAAGPGVPVRPEVVPTRPHRGVYVTVAAESAAVSGDGVAGVWEFADGERALTVAWCEADPVTIADRVLPPRDAVFAGPVETIDGWDWDWFEGR